MTDHNKSKNGSPTLGDEARALAQQTGRTVAECRQELLNTRRAIEAGVTKTGPELIAEARAARAARDQEQAANNARRQILSNGSAPQAKTL